MKIKFWEQAFTRTIQSTESDYHRGLMQAFPGCVSIGDPIRIDWQDVIVEIRLRHLPDFSVGLVVLPMLEAKWEFVKGLENRQRELLAKADLSMQRGLGQTALIDRGLSPMKALGKLVRLKKGDLGTKRDQLLLIILKQIIKYPEQNN